MRLLEEYGPACGYYPEPSKSIFVPCSPEATDEYGFIGSEPQIQKWVARIETLSHVMKRYPQTAYAGLMKSLQTEWMYLQCVVPGIEGTLALHWRTPSRNSEANLTALRPLLGLGVGKVGLGRVPDPSDTARCNIIASQSITGALRESLVERYPLNTVIYSQGSSQIRKDCRRDRMIQDKSLEDLKAASSSLVERRRMDRATETGAWFTVIPDWLNGTNLLADEFRDSLLLHFGLTPHSLPHRCEGC
eukprot:scaffold180215_cov36-Attheya_sp.AAC.2